MHAHVPAHTGQSPRSDPSCYVADTPTVACKGRSPRHRPHRSRSLSRPLQVLTANVVALIWNTYMSFQSHKAVAGEQPH
jgi:hypothetical protein